MGRRGRPRKEGVPAPDPPRDPAREEREARDAAQERQFQTIMTSIQALSKTMQMMAERQQPQQPQNVVPIPETAPVPEMVPIVEAAAPLVPPIIPPVIPVEQAETSGITPTAAQYKAFMSTKPLRFNGKEGADRAEGWLEEVENAFDIMDIPLRHRVRFGTSLLVDDAKAWWKSLLDIRFGGQQPTWEEFSAEFRETYVPQVARDHRVREFLDLVQAGRSVAEYVARFGHLQRYSPQLFSSERERANRFVWGLDEGLRPRVMSSNPATLLQAVEMATRMEEDYHRSQAFARKQKGLAPVPYQFKKPSGPTKMPRPPFSRPTASQRSIPIRCPRCTAYHPRGECPRFLVCFHCSQPGHIWRDCPQRRDRAPSVTASSPVIPQRLPTGIAQPRAVPAITEARREVTPAASTSAPVPAPQRGRPAGRIYTTSLQDLQSQDLIQGTLLLNEFFVRVLFDTGSSHSFIARELARQLGNEVIVAPFALRISSPLGVKQIDVEYIVVE
ncbi:unnamed protein product [Victoria cruziana]